MNLEFDTTTAARWALLIALLSGSTYLGGTYTVAFETGMYRTLLERPFRALEAYWMRREAVDSIFGIDLWERARFDSRGVVYRDPEQTWGDYTFYTTSFRSRAQLIDMEGRVVHEWSRPFRSVWEDPPHTDRPPPSTHIFWRRAHLYPDGDVLAVYTTVADTPYGYGLVKVDRDSDVLWSYPEHTHHDVDVADDGSIYAIVQQFRDTDDRPVEGVPQYPSLIMEDYLVRLSPGGEETLRVNLLDLLAESGYRALPRMYAAGSPSPASPAPGAEQGDVLHTNTVEVVGARFASHHDFADAGDVFVSFRTLDAIALVDPEGPSIEWLSRGFWWEQHDPDALANGRVLLFDNRGYGGPGGRSRIVEFEPQSGRITWSYHGRRKRPFQSLVRGTQQRLPNGNVLITSSQSGRLLEVTRDRETVWEYHNPMRRSHEGEQYTTAVLGARRVRAERLEFELRGPE